MQCVLFAISYSWNTTLFPGVFEMVTVKGTLAVAKVSLVSTNLVTRSFSGNVSGFDIGTRWTWLHGARRGSGWSYTRSRLGNLTVQKVLHLRAFTKSGASLPFTQSIDFQMVRIVHVRIVQGNIVTAFTADHGFGIINLSSNHRAIHSIAPAEKQTVRTRDRASAIELTLPARIHSQWYLHH